MSDLERITARRKELQAELADLEVAERVIRSLIATARPKITLRVGRSFKRIEGIPAHQSSVLAILDEHGGTMERAALLEAINARRNDPMAETTYASILSRMGSAELITRADGKVSRVQREMPM